MEPVQQLSFDFEQERRTIILSLMPDPFERIFIGEKKYEYRRKFVREAVNAFIYVSSPIKEIRGYIEFGRPIMDKINRIADIAELEKPGGGEGIVEYLKGLEMGFAIPVASYWRIQSLSLGELRDKFNFTAPQSYIHVDSNPKLREVLFARLAEVKP